MVDFYLSAILTVLITSGVFYLSARKSNMINIKMMIYLAVLNSAFCVLFPALFNLINGIRGNTDVMRSASALFVMVIITISYILVVFWRIVLRARTIDLDLAIPEADTNISAPPFEDLSIKLEETSASRAKRANKAKKKAKKANKANNAKESYQTDKNVSAAQDNSNADQSVQETVTEHSDIQLEVEAEETWQTFDEERASKAFEMMQEQIVRKVRNTKQNSEEDEEHKEESDEKYILDLSAFKDDPLDEALFIQSTAAYKISLEKQAGTMINGSEGQKQAAEDGDTHIEEDGDMLVTEDGDTLVTEDSDMFVTEDGDEIVEEGGDTLTTEDGETLVTEDGEALIVELEEKEIIAEILEQADVIEEPAAIEVSTEEPSEEPADEPMDGIHAEIELTLHERAGDKAEELPIEDGKPVLLEIEQPKDRIAGNSMEIDDIHANPGKNMVDSGGNIDKMGVVNELHLKIDEIDNMSLIELVHVAFDFLDQMKREEALELFYKAMEKQPERDIEIRIVIQICIIYMELELCELALDILENYRSRYKDQLSNADFAEINTYIEEIK